MALPDDAAPPPSDAPDLTAVARALSACVRETLERGEPAAVPELGTFRIEHRAAQAKEQKDGRLSIAPPRDEIVFAPADEMRA